MSRMGFQKKNYLDRGVGGWVELYPIFFWIFGIFLTLQSPLGVRLMLLWAHSILCTSLVDIMTLLQNFFNQNLGLLFSGI